MSTSAVTTTAETTTSGACRYGTGSRSSGQPTSAIHADFGLAAPKRAPRARGLGGVMLQLALLFLIVGIVSGLLGFTAIAGASFVIAKFLAGLFLVLFLVFLILAIAGVRKVMS